jgi:large subunit ribosomal protein L22
VNSRLQELSVATDTTKVRQIIPLIKGRKVGEATEILALTPKKGARLIKKLLDSAYANYRQKRPGVTPDELLLVNLFCDAGPMFKRIFPRARTRRDIRRHRTSHITLTISDETYLSGKKSK